MRLMRPLQLFGIVAVVVGLPSCDGKKREPAVIFFGSDTLTIEKVAELSPGTMSDSLRVKNVAIRLVCAGVLPDSSGDSLAQTVAERIALISGDEWSPQAGALLLHAAEVVAGKAGDLHQCELLKQFTDSLSKSAAKLLVVQIEELHLHYDCDSMPVEDSPVSAWFVSNILGVKPAVASLVMEFIEQPSVKSEQPSADKLKKMMSGLVSSQAAPAAAIQKKTGMDKKKEYTGNHPDNSAEVLKYRNQQSIRDSITRHIPNLKQLYKKYLKGSTFSGKVVITFRVAASGEAMSAEYKSSEIANMDFLDAMLPYLKTIRFKPIPDKTGTMTFDFPFEFNEEM